MKDFSNFWIIESFYFGASQKPMLQEIHLGKDDRFKTLFISDSSAYRDLHDFFITSSKSLSPKVWKFPRSNAS